MRHWDLLTLDVAPHQPEVIQSDGEGRTIVLNLRAGERLQEHQTHERSWLLVVDGEVEVDSGSDSFSGGVGLLAVFDPAERREVRAVTDTRLLLLLGPWPGEGHPSQR